MNNYEFCAQWVVDQDLGEAARVLDYGCGAGQIVKELRKRRVQAFGCDVFYEGGDYAEYVDANLLEEGVIRRMRVGGIPFSSASFDLVLSNQVMEHVENLDHVLGEIQRVLKPGGTLLSLFPDAGVWREGHCGIPFLHWFSKGGRTRVYYAAGLRVLGLGYYKGDKSAMRWSEDFCTWLDNWTHYRTKSDINSVYGRYFQEVRHIEEHWLQQRLDRRKPFVAWIPETIQRLVVNKLCGMVFVARKPGDGAPLTLCESEY